MTPLEAVGRDLTASIFATARIGKDAATNSPHPLARVRRTNEHCTLARLREREESCA